MAIGRIVGISETGTTLTISERPCFAGGGGCRVKIMWFRPTGFGQHAPRCFNEFASDFIHGFWHSGSDLGEETKAFAV